MIIIQMIIEEEETTTKLIIIEEIIGKIIKITTKILNHLELEIKM